MTLVSCSHSIWVRAVTAAMVAGTAVLTCRNLCLKSDKTDQTQVGQDFSPSFPKLINVYTFKKTKNQMREKERERDRLKTQLR